MIVAISTAPRAVRNWQQASRRTPCPICEHPDWCRAFDDGAWECMRTPNDHPCRSGGWMYWPGGKRPDDWQARIAATPPPPLRPAIDLALVDRANRALLGGCPLSDDDRAGLHDRGLTDAEIAGTFGTMPSSPAERARVVAAVTEAIGRDPAGVVPGFVRKQGKTDLVHIPGLIVAGWTDDGLLGSMQVRVASPGDGGKYRHLSAGDGPGSIGADGHFVNVSRPSRPVSMSRVVLTEGYIKGLVIAHRLGRGTLSVAGVGNTAKVIPTLKRLGGVAEVWMAYDRDSATNTHVAAAEAKIARELTATGYEVKQLVWPEEYGKGLDDALQAGVIPVAISHPALTERREDDTVANANAGHTIEQVQRERDSARLTIQARIRIQRNTRLPGRPMAQVLTGVLANATTASAPAGKYQGRVPPGFVYAPVRELALDAGASEGAAGKQLKAIEDAGLIRRKSLSEILPAGQMNPDTGEVLRAPLVFCKHFVAIAGHEHEPVTPELVRELVNRMASYHPGTPEQRGGKRIPRCSEHPEAEVHKDWVTYCSVCEKVLDSNTGEVVPAMLLEPLSEAKFGADAPDEQTLLVREAPVAPTRKPPTLVRDSLGIRPIAHEVDERDEAEWSGVTDRGPTVRSMAPNLVRIPADQERLDRSYAHLTAWQTRNAAADEPDPPPPPPLTLFPLAEAGCPGCGAAVAEGRTFCRACDPRSA